MAQVRLAIRPPAIGTSPIIVFLHGAGENELSYIKLAECAAANGFIGVAISGPIRLPHGGCCWPQDSLTTRDCITDALIAKDLLGGPSVSRIFLCRFSQGATHAFDLLATHPDTFMGGIVLSPGDGPVPSFIGSPELKTRGLIIAYGQREFRIFRKRAEKFAGPFPIPLCWQGRRTSRLRYGIRQVVRRAGTVLVVSLGLERRFLSIDSA